MNDFFECLEQSHKASDLELWSNIYHKAFPDMLEMIDHRENGEWQKFGIDRSIILRNTKQILVDEKIRFRNKITGKVYEDIALEEWSVEDKVPGWVCKPLRADYIAYAIGPLGICYMLPVIQLQTAWRQYADIWKQNTRPVRAHNYGYDTISWPVTPKVLFQAIGQQLRISFSPCEEETL